MACSTQRALTLSFSTSVNEDSAIVTCVLLNIQANSLLSQKSQIST